MTDNGTHRDRERVQGAARGRPCPVCGGDHKCGIGDGGLILCGRTEGPADGFIHMGPAKDPTWHAYRRADDPTVTRPGPRARMSGKRPDPPPPDWQARHDEYRAAFDGMRDELAEALGIPGWALDAVGYGWSPQRGEWTAAERDGAGNVIGIHRRQRDGQKLSETGGKRGLIIPDGFPAAVGPVLLVEGASDTAALVAAGLCAVGRPSNTGGVGQLAVLLRDLPTDRAVIVVGENDRKPDGKWPGREGAEGTAKRLAEALGRRVSWALPPAGTKDVRGWLTGRVGPDATADGWTFAGLDLARILTASATAEGPAPPEPAEPPPLTLGELVDQYPDLRPVLIDGLLRLGETMNVIAASKVGKSWAVLDLALSVATGRPWLGRFATTPGRVLILDNELHPETLAHRLRTVMSARGVRLADVRDRILIKPLRGRLQDLTQLKGMIEEWGIKRGDVSLIVCDALYRFFPVDTDENSNAGIASLYNLVDHLADAVGAGLVLVHHASKGSQTDKAVTDVGSGAGSISRATDTHLVLRPHQEDDVAVLEAAVRSFAPVEPLCIRWAFPTWGPADDLNPGQLGDPAAKRKQEAADAKVRQDGTTLLNTLDDLDPDKEGVGESKLMKRLAWGQPRLRNAVAPLLRDGVLEDCTVAVGIGNGATRPANGLRRPGGKGTEAPPTEPAKPQAADLPFDAFPHAADLPFDAPEDPAGGEK